MGPRKNDLVFLRSVAVKDNDFENCLGLVENLTQDGNVVVKTKSGLTEVTPDMLFVLAQECPVSDDPVKILAEMLPEVIVTFIKIADTTFAKYQIEP